MRPKGLLSALVRSTVPRASPFGLQVAEVTFCARVVLSIVGAASSQARRASGRAEVDHTKRARRLDRPGRIAALSARIKIAIRGSTRGRADRLASTWPSSGAERGFRAYALHRQRDVPARRPFHTDVLGGEVVMEGEPTIVQLANSWVIINVGGGPTEDKPEVVLDVPDDPNRVSAFLNIRVADIQALRRVELEGAEFLTRRSSTRPRSAATCATPTATRSRSARRPRRPQAEALRTTGCRTGR